MFSKDFLLGVVKNQSCMVKSSLFTTNKILDFSKLKAFTDNKINVTQKLKFVSGRVQNNLGKEENAYYQHFSFSDNVFKILTQTKKYATDRKGERRKCW